MYAHRKKKTLRTCLRHISYFGLTQVPWALSSAQGWCDRCEPCSSSLTGLCANGLHSWRLDRGSGTTKKQNTNQSTHIYFFIIWVVAECCNWTFELFFKVFGVMKPLKSLIISFEVIPSIHILLVDVQSCVCIVGISFITCGMWT